MPGCQFVGVRPCPGLQRPMRLERFCTDDHGAAVPRHATSAVGAGENRVVLADGSTSPKKPVGRCLHRCAPVVGGVPVGFAPGRTAGVVEQDPMPRSGPGDEAAAHSQPANAVESGRARRQGPRRGRLPRRRARRRRAVPGRRDAEPASASSKIAGSGFATPARAEVTTVGERASTRRSVLGGARSQLATTPIFRPRCRSRRRVRRARHLEYERSHERPRTRRPGGSPRSCRKTATQSPQRARVAASRPSWARGR